MKNNYLFLTFFLSLFLIMSCSTPKSKHNILTEQEAKEGWMLLFDGKSLTNWHKYGDSQVGEAWNIKDESIHLDVSEKDGWQVKGGGDIVTSDVFEGFHLKLEWKIAVGGNSGIIFYVKEDTTKYQYPWQTGPEMQILDNAKHADAKIEKHRAGDLYDLISCEKETVKPAGQWNQVEIISDKGMLQFFLNGYKVVETSIWTDEWFERIKQSKFVEFPDFGTIQKGKICLQDHGDEVWFRNIKIKKY